MSHRRSAAKPAPERPPTRGLADFARLVFAGATLQPTWDALMARATGDAADVGAMLDLSTSCNWSASASRDWRCRPTRWPASATIASVIGTGDGPRLLALVAAGDLMASTPVEFLLTGWNGELDLIFLDPRRAGAIGIPEHDVAILAVGESDANAPLLAPLAGRRAALAEADAERVAGRHPGARPRPRAGEARRRAGLVAPPTRASAEG